jgi:hypothetical protein
MGNRNPFVGQIEDFVEGVISLACQDEVLTLVGGLPDGTSERVNAIRNTFTVDALAARDVPLPDGLRIAPRWFEDRTEVSNADRYVPEKYIDGYPGGSPKPKPPPPPKPTPITVCGTVGVVVCVSVGG